MRCVFEGLEMKIIAKSAALIGLAVLVAGCTVFQRKEVAGPPIANGKWASGDGVYTAEFLNGTFRAVANDTGNVISQGSYIASSKDNITLKWRSNLTGKDNQATCIKPEVNVMNCTDANGSRFSLRRGA